MTPFTPGKKVPMEYAGVFDTEDYGNYFVEENLVWSEEEANRLFKKYCMNILTPSEQEIVEKEIAKRSNKSDYGAGYNIGFEYGVEFALQELVKGRMTGFAEWIAHRGFFLTSDGKWNAYNTRGPVADTTEQLYSKYQEQLKQQEGSNDIC